MMHMLPPAISALDPLHLAPYGPRWRNGRRASFRNWWPQGRAGSNPAPGTTNQKTTNDVVFWSLPGV